MDKREAFADIKKCPLMNLHKSNVTIMLLPAKIWSLTQSSEDITGVGQSSSTMSNNTLSLISPNYENIK